MNNDNWVCMFPLCKLSVSSYYHLVMLYYRDRVLCGDFIMYIEINKRNNTSTTLRVQDSLFIK